MQFWTLPRGQQPRKSSAAGAYLQADNWDDFHYKTSWVLHYVNDGAVHEIGFVKIGDRDGTLQPSIPKTFSELSSDYFSLGQSVEYYARLKDLGDEVRESLLGALHDIAADLDLFREVIELGVTQTSLLRDIRPRVVRDQFHRVAARGADVLTPFAFTYSTPAIDRHGDAIESVKLDFEVVLDSTPRTNLHALIGRNGVGKSFILNDIVAGLVEPDDCLGEVRMRRVEGRPADDEFACVLSVAFSAFDTFEPHWQPEGQLGIQEVDSLRYEYIGLKKRPKGQSLAARSMSPSELERQFQDSLTEVVFGHRVPRWRRILQVLASDPVFAIEVSPLLSYDEDELVARLSSAFRGLSSGHKIVLLTLTRLVQFVDEATLVLVDEPESHLHPPLLAAFLKALSDLLVERNGVAIIATHSPVVLQEIPASCVWKLNGLGGPLSLSRPALETYGENVGTLTQEAFGLEVTTSGFYKALDDAVTSTEDADFNEILQQFGDHLGSEARALLRALVHVAQRE